ncbi:MAG: hypothetical protein JXB26_07660 [Candidatus Aminicenantes bacterium]|nr:hypothetical protein [Candidatus Aminicenantes bacterium]
MKKYRLIPLFILLSALTVYGDGLESLSGVFRTGVGLTDTDGDNLADAFAFRIVLPDAPNPYEIAAAGDIAARATLDSLAADMSLIIKESELSGLNEDVLLILVGSRLRQAQKMMDRGIINGKNLSENQGWIGLFNHNGKKGIAVTAGSDKTLLKTARAFFLRWPYLWDIWGRETGATYFKLEKELDSFLEKRGIKTGGPAIVSTEYFFFLSDPPRNYLSRLEFDRDEIDTLNVILSFPDETNRDKAQRMLEELNHDRLRGNRTDVLSYPGCARLKLRLRSAEKESTVTLERAGFPKRMLTPSYKSPPSSRKKKRRFDLTRFLSLEGVYGDGDGDGIADKMETILVLPEKGCPAEAAFFGSRLVLHAAGASFPLYVIDKEIKEEEEQSLVCPVIVGRENLLAASLVKQGKLRFPSLEPGRGWVQVVPGAFGESDALVVIGGDKNSLGRTLQYMAEVFPHLASYGEGNPGLQDVADALSSFLKGEKGAAKAAFHKELCRFTEEIKDTELESFEVELDLHRPDAAYEDFLRKTAQKTLGFEGIKISGRNLKEGQMVFEKEKTFAWEADEAFDILTEHLSSIAVEGPPLDISLGVSESPDVRKSLKSRVETWLQEKGFLFRNIEVFSAYKQGFFRLTEKVLPALKEKGLARLHIRFPVEKIDFDRHQRFYSEPFRWLQELYPVDEILAPELGISLENIIFEKDEGKERAYEVEAFDGEGRSVYKDRFSPRTRTAPFLEVLPEWGDVRMTTGWVKADRGEEVILDRDLKTDLERFWDFYQKEVLSPLYAHVMKKTRNAPHFSKQPYFKRLLVEMWFSEPDYRLGLDEEIISSLEAMHDELYFDTLDFLRGITEIKIEDQEVPEDTSRYSAPGNVLPLIHPSREGQPGRVKVVLEEQRASKPAMTIKWQEKGRSLRTRKFTFDPIEPDTAEIPALLFNGSTGRIENLTSEVSLKKEKDYLSLIDIARELSGLEKQGKEASGFGFPGLDTLTLKIKHENLFKEEFLPVKDISSKAEMRPEAETEQTGEEPLVPTTAIISPDMCLDIVGRLSRYASLRSYTAGQSYEGRDIPVLEAFIPLQKYISTARLATFKPTLYINARQHANEVCSTNYILRFAELLGKEKAVRSRLQKMNIVLHPMENPDGSQLAYDLQKLTPFHSLHAGRYSALGMDIGYQISAKEPILPEAKVRGKLMKKWAPDIHLNLHGYPSHEWVQQFSNYVPYLFRDYWIPRGWFAYYRALSLPFYKEWSREGRRLRDFIIEEMNLSEEIEASNRKFYDRYDRWAGRWQPHMDYLEIYDGLNLYAERRSSRESRLTPGTRTTYVSEVPELMDETARGDWLDFLCRQGLRYIEAHVKYLAQTRFETARIEEEYGGRIHIQFLRRRPGEKK